MELVHTEVWSIWESSQLIVLGTCGVISSSGGSENVVIDAIDIVRAPDAVMIDSKIRVVISLSLAEVVPELESGVRYIFPLEIPPLSTGVFHLQGRDLRGVIVVSDPLVTQFIEWMQMQTDNATDR